MALGVVPAYLCFQCFHCRLRVIGSASHLCADPGAMERKALYSCKKNFVSAPLAEPGIEMDEACATPNQHSLVALQQFFLPYSPLAHFALSFTLPIVSPENCKQRPERVDVFSAELHRTKLL